MIQFGDAFFLFFVLLFAISFLTLKLQCKLLSTLLLFHIEVMEDLISLGLIACDFCHIGDATAINSALTLVIDFYWMDLFGKHWTFLN